MSCGPTEHWEIELVFNVSEKSAEGPKAQSLGSKVSGRNSEVSSCTISKNRNSHLTSALAPLILIGLVGFRIDSIDAIAVVVSGNV